MKTSKEKSKPKKTSKVKEVVKNKKVKITKQGPTEEEIRDKAMEIYQQRINRGEHGTAENDWLEAEKSLRDSHD
jgi:hypothetical protein